MSSILRASLIALCLAAPLAHAQAVRTERNMSLELANQIAAAGVAACAANGYSVTVTVVDRAGGVRAVQRADNAGPHTLACEPAEGLHGGVGEELDAWPCWRSCKRTRAQRTLVDIPGFLVLGGGVPIKVGTEVIGGVGIGGAPGRQPRRPVCDGGARQGQGPAEVTALRLGLVLAALALCPLPAVAQVPPTAAEAAAYTGLHAAAWRGDVPAVERLAAGGKAALEARDAQGRTPLHVATFARQRGAVKALLEGRRRHRRVRERPLRRGDHRRGSRRRGDARASCSPPGASAKLVTSRYDGTALIAAAHLGHDGVVRQLIDGGRAARPRQQPALDRADRGDRAGRRRQAAPGDAWTRCCAPAPNTAARGSQRPDAAGTRPLPRLRADGPRAHRRGRALSTVHRTKKSPAEAGPLAAVAGFSAWSPRP